MRVGKSAGGAFAVIVLLVLGWLGDGYLDRPPGGPGGSQPPAEIVTAKAATLGSGEVWLDTLPGEATRVVRLIRSGGPFPYRKDGSTFQNREKRLPKRPRGHYREYTVPTPGASNRGARRIVAGGPATQPEAMYDTADHYRTFRRIRER